jgi:hypothetical protein
MRAGKLSDGDHDDNREENKRHVEPQVSAAHTSRMHKCLTQSRPTHYPTRYEYRWKRLGIEGAG